jgi:FkbM family methyltransferase
MIKFLYKKLKTIKIKIKNYIYPSKYVLDGVAINVGDTNISTSIKNSIYGGGYEKAEREFLLKVIKPGDRFLEVGSGLGVLTTLACKIVGDENVRTFEAMPISIKLSEKTFEENSVSPDVIKKAVVADDREKVTFYGWDAFWSSSSIERKELGEPKFRYEVLTARLSDELINFRPDVCLIDAEGGEIEFVDDIIKVPPQWLILETHPKIYGQDASNQIIDCLTAKAYCIDEQVGNVYLMHKVV